jgi:hypothetical protein
MQRDFVLRWIEQLGRLIRRLLRGGGSLEEGRRQVDDAIEALLGPLALLIPKLEVESAASLLGDPDRIFAYAQLLELDALIAAAAGEAGTADRTRRALEFARAALGRATESRPDWQQWIAERADGPLP